MPLGGQWRAGSSGKIATDTDPWSGATLTEISLAARMTSMTPSPRPSVPSGPGPRNRRGPAGSGPPPRCWRLAGDEVTDWLIHETGAPVAAAELEWNQAREALLTAAALPYQVTGSIVPSDLPGRQIRVCRVPAGVIAVISPRELPAAAVQPHWRPRLRPGTRWSSSRPAIRRSPAAC